MRDFIRQFLLYSRSERRAVMVLMLMIVFAILIPGAYHFYTAKSTITLADSSILRDIAALRSADTTSDDDATGARLFRFDPNVIGISDWIRLGLTEKQAAVIEKYKAKGGRFHKPDDLRKIYVLSDEMKDRLLPYIQIEHDESQKGGKDFYTIEINAADSSAYEELEGIGPAYASRIVRYRSKLGGFYRIEQVGEAYGISDSTFQMIRPHLRVDPARITQIDINETDYETLRKHPYIHAKIAHAIIGYRNMNGKYDSIGQIRLLKPITDQVYYRIRPYLTAK